MFNGNSAVMPREHDVVIFGAGAAGLMCGIYAGKRGRKTLILEHSDAIGKKIRISGGGRCNFTNIHTTPAQYLSQNPHFCRSALARYTPADFIGFIEHHGISYHEKKLGQLFCDGSSRQIVQALEAECRNAQVEICTHNTLPEGIHSIIWDGQYYTIITNTEKIRCHSLVIATGGASIPAMGATGFGYDLAQKFGLQIITPQPALVPLILPHNLSVFTGLSGISVDGEVVCGTTLFREHLLFTHQGVSGPAILQISSYWSEGETIAINLDPNKQLEGLLSQERQSKFALVSLLTMIVPKRLAEVWCGHYFPTLANTPLNQCSTADLKRVMELFRHWAFIPAGTAGFAKAEVTRGGVDTKELSSKTMQAQGQPGLYCIGEVVDVTGWLGGYNFQWAWASGFAAGTVV